MTGQSAGLSQRHVENGDPHRIGPQEISVILSEQASFEWYSLPVDDVESLDLFSGAFDRIDDGLDVLLVGKGAHNVGLQCDHGLAVVSFSKAICH